MKESGNNLINTIYCGSDEVITIFRKLQYTVFCCILVYFICPSITYANSYIIYDENIWYNQDINIETIIEWQSTICDSQYKNYNKANVNLVKLNNNLSFTDAWNSLPEEPIETLIIMCHGNYNTLSQYLYDNSLNDYYSKNLYIEDIEKLSNKNINTLFILSCDTGHLNFSKNIAEAFENKKGINKIIAPDGTPYFYIDNNDIYCSGGDITDTWTNLRDCSEADVKNDYCWQVINDNLVINNKSNERQSNYGNMGWIVYQDGYRVQLSNKKYLSTYNLFHLGWKFNINDYIKGCGNHVFEESAR